jgi:hypothetical protein
LYLSPELDIAAREVVNEMTMATVTILCSVGFVAILKTNFVPGAQATVGGVNADSGVRRADGGRKGVQE